MRKSPKKRLGVLLGAGLLVALLLVVVVCRDTEKVSELDTGVSSPKALAAEAPTFKKNHKGDVEKVAVETEREDGKASAEGSEEQVSAEDAFDAEVDRWMEPREGGVEEKAVNAFRTAFGRVPKEAKAACLQRALNLIPDENIMLLAGILLDKTQDREVLDAVFSDVLNRDESVKNVILKQIFKDKSHPCWADTAWILDVTGEKQ